MIILSLILLIFSETVLEKHRVRERLATTEESLVLFAITQYDKTFLMIKVSRLVSS